MKEWKGEKECHNMLTVDTFKEFKEDKKNPLGRLGLCRIKSDGHRYRIRPVHDAELNPP